MNLLRSIDSGLLSFNNLVHATSGAIAGSLAVTVLFPFETVRTRLQVDEGRKSKFSLRLIYDLAHEEGFLTLYRGWASLIVSLSVTNFVYFYVFHGLRLYVGPTQETQSVYKDLLFGIIAGMLAVVVSNPLWVVNTRLKLQGVRLKADVPSSAGGNTLRDIYSGTVDGLFQIARAESLLALWSGLGSSLVLVSNPAINFMVYEGLKRNTFNRLQFFFSSSSLYFSFGGISKLIATVLTYPIQLIQTRSRAGLRTSRAATVKLCSLSFWFRGLESKIMQSALTSALMQVSYERIVHLLLLVYSGGGASGGERGDVDTDL